MYVNQNYGATVAEVLTKTKLDSWYTKYINNGETANAGNKDMFQQIYGTKYENLIDNYSYYWLPQSITSDGMYYISPGDRCEYYSSNHEFGVRILVTLSPNVRFDATSTETKTVVSSDNNTTFAVWNFAQ